MNTAERPRTVLITASGIEGMRLIVPQPIDVPAATMLTVPVALRIDSATASPGSHPVRFHIEDSTDPRVRADEKSIFYVR